jgi:Spy/CpxP family protein refolding chaperone
MELFWDASGLIRQKREGIKMKNKLTKIVAVLAVAGLMVAGPVAYAESNGDSPAGGKGYKRGEGKEFFKELNLTPEQKEKLKAQREAKKEANKALRDQLKTKMKALHDEISKPGSTRAGVDGLVGEVNALKGQMFAQKIDGVFSMKEALTPEQFAKMQEKHQGWMQKKHEGWGKGKQCDLKKDSPEAEKE